MRGGSTSLTLPTLTHLLKRLLFLTTPIATKQCAGLHEPRFCRDVGLIRRRSVSTACSPCHLTRRAGFGEPRVTHVWRLRVWHAALGHQIRMVFLTVAVAIKRLTSHITYGSGLLESRVDVEFCWFFQGHPRCKHVEHVARMAPETRILHCRVRQGRDGHCLHPVVFVVPTLKPSVSMSNTDCLAPSARASLVNIQRYPGSPRPFFDFAALSPRRPGELRPPIVDRRCLRWIFWPGQLPAPVFSAHENTRMPYPSVGQSYFPRPRDARGRKDTARNCREGYLCSLLDRCWLC